MEWNVLFMLCITTHKINITTASSFNCRSQQLTLIYLNMSCSKGNDMCVKSENLSMHELPNCKYTLIHFMCCSFTAFAKCYTYIHTHRQEDGWACARMRTHTHTHTHACIHAHITHNTTHTQRQRSKSVGAIFTTTLT